MAKGPSTVTSTGSFVHGTITPLTGSVGTANGAIEDVTGTPTQSAINNNFAEVVAKLNEIIQVLKDRGDIA